MQMSRSAAPPERRIARALDDLHHPLDSLGSWNGLVLYTWPLHSHSSLARHRRRADRLHAAYRGV